MSAGGRASVPVTLRSLVRATAGRLGSVSEARWVVAHALGVGDRELAARLDQAVSPATASALDTLTARRLAGEPLQYVLGHWAFRSLDVVVDARVLVPRPETEQVVDVALVELATQAARAPVGSDIVAVDLGTGSGVIALSLAVEGVAAMSGAARAVALEVWATDASAPALEVARLNIDALAGRDALAAGRVRLVRGSWFDALPPALAGRVALVVSNPPYVAPEEWEGLEPVVRCHEPRQALVAGRAGSRGARAHRRPGAPLARARREPRARDGPAPWRRAGGAGHELGLRACRGARRPRGPSPHARGAPGRIPIAGGRGQHPPPRRRARRWVSAPRAEPVRAVAGRRTGRGRWRPWRRAPWWASPPTPSTASLSTPRCPGATAALFALKRRPETFELPVLVAGVAQADALAADGLAPVGRALAEALWPGALTIVVERRDGLDLDLGGDGRTIGLRCPAHAGVLAVCRAVGPLAATSANVHGAAPCTRAEEVRSVFGAGVAVVVDGGRCEGLASTVVDVTGGRLRCLRTGAVSWTAVEQAASGGDRPGPL